MIFTDLLTSFVASNYQFMYIFILIIFKIIETGMLKKIRYQQLRVHLRHWPPYASRNAYHITRCKTQNYIIGPRGSLRRRGCFCTLRVKSSLHLDYFFHIDSACSTVDKDTHLFLLTIADIEYKTPENHELLKFYDKEMYALQSYPAWRTRNETLMRGIDIKWSNRNGNLYTQCRKSLQQFYRYYWKKLPDVSIQK